MRRREPPPPLGRSSRWLGLALLALVTARPSWVVGAFLVGLVLRAVLLLRRRVPARREPAPGDGVPLGVDTAGRRVMVTDAALRAHGLILGASGAGKSTTLLAILTSQLHQGQPVVAIDLKGSPDFATHLATAARAAGRRFRCWTPDGPETWNPLAAGNATELKDKLIATERFSEPHYQRAAERYVQLALQVMQSAEPDRPVTLARVVEVLDPPRLLAATRRLPTSHAERVRDYLTALTADQLSAVRGFAARLAVVSESHTGRYLEEGGEPIDLRRALRDREVVLFSLNASTYGSLAAQLGTLAVQDLVAAAGQRLSLMDTAPVTVGIDEFSALGSDNVLSLLARGREAGVSVVLATQELADLDRAGRGLRDQVLGNTAVKIVHRQEVPGSAETAARMAGTERVWERSYHLGPGPWGGTDRRGGTLRLVDRYAVEPDQIRSLPTGAAVVIVKVPRAHTRLTRIAAASPPGRAQEPPGRAQEPPGVTR